MWSPNPRFSAAPAAPKGPHSVAHRACTSNASTKLRTLHLGGAQLEAVRVVLEALVDALSLKNSSRLGCLPFWGNRSLTVAARYWAR
jgi:hypothetical protein